MASTCTCVEGSGRELATFDGPLQNILQRTYLVGADCVGQFATYVGECSVSDTYALVEGARSGVPRELVHRARPQDVVPTGWERRAENRFLVSGRWPEDHGFFAPADGLHDALLLVESMRQSTILIGHGAYGVPLGHHFLMGALDFTCAPSHLRATGSHEVEIEVSLSGTTWRAGHLSSMDSRVTVRREGGTAGVGVSSIRIMNPRTYARVRGGRTDAAGMLPPEPGVPPHTVGRTRPEDVLLAPASRSDQWQLRVDTGHTTLYQGAKDHIPGMVLIEAARQAAYTLMGPAAFHPAAATNSFGRYAEFGEPIWIEAHPGQRRNTVVVTGRQEGEEVFRSSVTAPEGGADR
ncbi:ScbA/BarX family gamma-butyrolactone biosynthesis protein [Streptomyces sp. NPDC008125]|uniref:ScbA/BarX family gamma-butyrolactone biosynthesis protein n=1 Tax=Streptomyces sp. NPDC008125 TaxID=3364811 RepID=UPI0036E8E2EC